MIIILPPDMKLSSLSQLRRWFMAQDTQKPEHIEMTTEQYCDYKRLVFEADPIRRFMGVEIKLSPEKDSTEGDSSL